MFKIPVSVLVIIHTVDLQVLLLERADHPGYWQSVTGSQDSGETLLQTAMREVFEETGLSSAGYVLTNWQIENRYEIYQEWRWRYGPDVRFNTEHVFGLCLPDVRAIKISAREHLNYIWLPWQQAAEKVFSRSNAEAILDLPERV
ncbi:dihydroneopterin triphosphate diphosphatase [Nitrosomonas supralitoralis]|uniref:Dihydroneopterin triphosphate diphosphatase n=1 Tax=Nitrosomonas supralitoralis TaxID=2116706 RepID=A0A2P7NW22_9PROT|nr:dihydroneopterin triphosphate diphosphatase [Nitrosomonas supralitoralis]PSJ17674.1 dihydroneopterin triphosphate diphosphatase [Nitrosomonas supralitoralis]